MAFIFINNLMLFRIVYLQHRLYFFRIYYSGFSFIWIFSYPSSSWFDIFCSIWRMSLKMSPTLFLFNRNANYSTLASFLSRSMTTSSFLPNLWIQAYSKFFSFYLDLKSSSSSSLTLSATNSFYKNLLLYFMMFRKNLLLFPISKRLKILFCSISCNLYSSSLW